VIATVSIYITKVGPKMNAQDGRAMFELQLELHSRAIGVQPLISADDLLEVHELLTEHEGDLKSLFIKPRR
jgi:hypothetical protein